MFGQEKKMVDAIEDGRIVSVTEDYARREGLMVLRKHEHASADPVKTQEQMKLTPRLKGERKAYLDMDKYRRPWRDKNEIIASLVDDFRWVLASRRKQLNLTRKQVAQAINVNEEEIKMLENGIIPQSDYVLISKIESFMKLNLRKDKSLSTGLQRGSGFGENRERSKPKWVGKVGVVSKNGSMEGAEKILGEGIELADQDGDEK